jgi:hypothetical protein
MKKTPLERVKIQAVEQKWNKMSFVLDSELGLSGMLGLCLSYGLHRK